jgi:hypothetical protein
MKQPIKRYDITQCALYRCKNKRRLEKLLTLKKYDLEKIDRAISYYSFQMDKKGTNEKRTINAPTLDLKLLQRRILRLLQKVERPDWLISGEKQKCYIDNGKVHQHSKYLLAMDIAKFYDNCNREPVFRFFTDYLHTSSDVAGVLTDIVTHEQKIPTGCPTSQMLAFYAYRKMFEEINAIAISHGCIFSLYVDDMTFSSRMPFNVKRLIYDVSYALRRYGHKPKKTKIKYYSKDAFKPVTGTVIDSANRLLIPNNLQEKVYKNFQAVKEKDFSRDCSEEDFKLVRTLVGQIQASKNIDENVFPEVSRLTKAMILPQMNTSSAVKRKTRRKVIRI